MPTIEPTAPSFAPSQEPSTPPNFEPSTPTPSLVSKSPTPSPTRTSPVGFFSALQLLDNVNATALIGSPHGKSDLRLALLAQLTAYKGVEIAIARLYDYRGPNSAIFLGRERMRKVRTLVSSTTAMNYTVSFPSDSSSFVSTVSRIESTISDSVTNGKLTSSIKALATATSTSCPALTKASASTPPTFAQAQLVGIPTSPPSSSPADKSIFTTTLIIEVAAGGAAFICCIAAGVWFYLHQRAKKRAAFNTWQDHFSDKTNELPGVHIEGRDSAQWRESNSPFAQTSSNAVAPSRGPTSNPIAQSF